MEWLREPKVILSKATKGLIVNPISNKALPSSAFLMMSSLLKGDTLYSSPGLAIPSLISSLFTYNIIYIYNIIHLLPPQVQLLEMKSSLVLDIIMGAFSWKPLHLTGICFHWSPIFAKQNNVLLSQNSPFLQGGGGMGIGLGSV